jgi:diguanylate cyclase (GGDEF)-like protein
MIPAASRRELARRAAPFTVAAVLAVALAAIGQGVRWIEYGAAVALGVLTVAAAAVIPWERLWGATSVLPVLLFLVSASLLRDAVGGASAGIGVLVLLPVVWCALYHRRAHLILVLVGVLIYFALPPVLIGGEAYPLAGLRQGAVTAVVGTVIGLCVQRLVHHIRRDAAHSEAQRVELQRLARESEHLLAELERVASTDMLTGLANRRAWSEWLTVAADAKRPFAVAMLDLDRFKAYNDSQGHAGGDALLAEAADVWTRALGNDGRMARVGGEEFAVLIDAAEADVAEATIERLRRVTPYKQTVSAGVAVWDGAECPDTLMRRADDALYTAKRLGRDRCVVAHPALV